MKRIIFSAVILLAASSAHAQTDSLAVYIEAAMANSPALARQYQAYKAQVAAACGEGQLSDPELTVGFYPEAMNHVNGKQIATFSLMQMFPWVGTLKAARQQKESMAEASFQGFRQAALDLALDMQRQWYGMLSTQEKIKSVERQRHLLDDIQKVAVYQYKTATMGRNSRMSDQLRIEAEVKRLDEKRASLVDELRLQRQQFNLSMHRGHDAELVLPDSIRLKEMPIVDWARIEANDPAVAQLEAQKKSFEAQDRMAKSQGMPKIGVGVEYMLNGKVDMPVMSNMNGKNMLMPMLKVTLPIYRRRTNMARKSAQLMRQSVESGIEQRQDALRASCLDISKRAADVERKVRLYDSETELLDKTLQLMRGEYANGSTSLTDILQTLREKIDYDLLKAEAYAQYNGLVAEMERLAVSRDYSLSKFKER